MLGMDVDEVFREGLQDRQGYGFVIDKTPGPSGPVQGPADQEGVAHLQVVLGHQGPQPLVIPGLTWNLSHGELRFHDTGFPMRPHERGVGLAAQGEAQGAEEDGLARSGLSGYNDETLRKINFQRVDQYVVPDVERAEHYSSPLMSIGFALCARR